MSILYDSAVRQTGRTYPDGYGLALIYLTDNPSPQDIKDMQEAAWEAVMRDTKAGGRDGARFVSAYADGVQNGWGWNWWIVEAAQLVHGDALAGSKKAAQVMKAWKHPGF